MEKFEYEPVPNPEVPDITARAQNASEKVHERVTGVLLENYKLMGRSGPNWLMGLQNDFYALVENPMDDVGGGNYDDWSPDEIRELYQVLYGEPMDA